MVEKSPNSLVWFYPHRQITITCPSSKPVSLLTKDLNAVSSKSDSSNSDSFNPDITNSNLLNSSKSPFPGFLMIYDKNTASQSLVQKTIFDWFDSILSKGNYVQNLEIFKSCLQSKQKCDQLLLEALKKVPNPLPTDEEMELHFLSFWYDLEKKLFYLYAVGMFDFFLFNGNAAGAPIVPIQNCSKAILTRDLTQSTISTILPQKTFHLIFENGLSSNGFFVYCGLPLEKTHLIHTSPILSRAFYRLKRDARPECQHEIEERIKKSFVKNSENPDSDLLDAFYYIFGIIPHTNSARPM